MVGGFGGGGCYARITRLPNLRIFNKKLYKLPELGGGMGIGYSGNAQKKTFFQEVIQQGLCGELGRLVQSWAAKK